jgi:hypothetical protein
MGGAVGDDRVIELDRGRRIADRKAATFPARRIVRNRRQAQKQGVVPESAEGDPATVSGRLVSRDRAVDDPQAALIDVDPAAEPGLFEARVSGGVAGDRARLDRQGRPQKRDGDPSPGLEALIAGDGRGGDRAVPRQGIDVETATGPGLAAREGASLHDELSRDDTEIAAE